MSPDLAYLSIFYQAAQVSLCLLRGELTSQEQRNELNIVFGSKRSHSFSLL